MVYDSNIAASQPKLPHTLRPKVGILKEESDFPLWKPYTNMYSRLTGQHPLPTTLLSRFRSPHQPFQLVQPPNYILLDQDFLEFPLRFIFHLSDNLSPHVVQHRWGILGGGWETGSEVRVGTGVYCVRESGGEHVVESCGAGTGGLGRGRGWNGGRGAVVSDGCRHFIRSSRRELVGRRMTTGDLMNSFQAILNGAFSSNLKALFTRLQTRCYLGD